MKWAIGILGVFLFFYFLAGPIFNAMKKHDYDSMYYGIPDAKRRAGSYVQDENKDGFMSYGEKYARGLVRQNQ